MRNVFLRLFASLLPFLSIATGQNVTLTLGSGSGTAGSAVTLPLTLASTGGAQSSVLEFSIAYPADISGFTLLTPLTNKAVSCVATTCLMWGTDATPFHDGTIATVTLNIVAKPVKTSLAVQIIAISDSSPAGLDVTLTGSTANITLPQSAGPSISSLTCSPTTIYTPTNSNCTVTLTSTATAGAVSVPLSSNNSNLVVPIAVLVPAGSSAVQFTASALQVTSVQNAAITAGTGTGAKNAQWTLYPPAAVQSVVCSPAALTNGASANCTVTMNEAMLTNAVVTLASGNSALTVPGSVTVLAGTVTVEFTASAANITAATPASTLITATFAGKSQTFSMGLQQQVLLKSLTCTTSTLGSNAATPCTVTLLQPVTVTTNVALKSNNGDLTVPAAATVAAGSASATFNATTAILNANNADKATITATSGNGSVATSISLPLAPQMTSFSCPQAFLLPQMTTQCTVGLVAGKSSATISLGVNMDMVSVPALVTAPPTAINAQFAVSAVAFTSPTTATITAKLGTRSIAITLKLLLSVQVTGLSSRGLPVGLYRVQVVGAGFTPRSGVVIDGAPVATSYVSPRLLVATGTATRSQSSQLRVIDDGAQSDSVSLQIGVAQPKLSYHAAARFLGQAAYGPSSDAIMHLQEVGIATWLSEQFAEQPSAAEIDAAAGLANAVQGTDQLRQRSAMALGELLRPQSGDPASAGRDLLPDIFGNYRQLLARTQPAEAVDRVFNDPAAGASVALGLIQSLVKTNPTDAYVGRVAAVFNNNGLGERGNLQSVISAVLLDAEARLGDVAGNDTTTAGRLQSDAEFVAGLLRALNADPATLGDMQSGFSKISSPLGARTESIQPRASVRDPWVWNAVHLLDLSSLVSMANSTEPLVTALDVVFLGGEMSSELRSTLTAALENQPDAPSRTRLGVFLVATSSEYNVRR